MTQIVPAVPSPSGVADVFAFQCEYSSSDFPCTGEVSVQAITSDGTVAWTAELGDAQPVLPDFLGGLVYVVWDDSGNTSSIMRVDGTTGQDYTLYTLPNQTWAENIAVHPDGTIFAALYDRDAYEDGNPAYSVIGIDPTTGAQKFRAQTSVQSPGAVWGRGASSSQVTAMPTCPIYTRSATTNIISRCCA